MYKLTTFGLLLITALAQDDIPIPTSDDFDAAAQDIVNDALRQSFLESGLTEEDLAGVDFSDEEQLAALYEQIALASLGEELGAELGEDLGGLDFADLAAIEDLGQRIEEEGEGYIPTGDDLTVLISFLEFGAAVDPEAQELLTQLQAAQSQASQDAASYTDEQKVAALQEMIDFIALPDAAEATVSITAAEATQNIGGTDITISVGTEVKLSYGAVASVDANSGATIVEGAETEITVTATLSEAIPAGYENSITLDYWVCAADAQGNFTGEDDECQYYQFYSAGITQLGIDYAIGDGTSAELATFFEDPAVQDGQFFGSFIDYNAEPLAVQSGSSCITDQSGCRLQVDDSHWGATEWKAVNLIQELDVTSISVEDALLARALADLALAELGDDGEDDDSSDDEDDAEPSGEVTAADLGITFISGMRITYQAPSVTDDSGNVTVPPVETQGVDAPQVSSEISVATLTADAAADAAAKQAVINADAEAARTANTGDNSVALKAVFGIAAIAASILAF